MSAARPHVILIGAGLAGSLLAVSLARRGFQVDVYERRPDMRTGRMSAGRSINLALSVRGIHALGEVGLADDILAIAIPSADGRELRLITPGKVLMPGHSYGMAEGKWLSEVRISDLQEIGSDFAIYLAQIISVAPPATDNSSAPGN